MNRRSFIGSVSAVMGALFLGKAELFTQGITDGIPDFSISLDDESFWKVIREQFVFTQDYIYFNTGGIGALPSVVLQRLKSSIDEGEIYPRPGHDLDDWRNIKSKCTGLLSPNCAKEEIAFVSAAKESINIILNGLPLKAGDEVITSTHKHPALHVPLINLSKREGIVIRTLNPVLQQGRKNIELIDRLINNRTKLVFISHVTCTTGQIFPIKEIG